MILQAFNGPLGSFFYRPGPSFSSIEKVLPNVAMVLRARASQQVFMAMFLLCPLLLHFSVQALGLMAEIIGGGERKP